MFTVNGERAGEACLVTKSLCFRGEVNLGQWAIYNRPVVVQILWTGGPIGGPILVGRWSNWWSAPGGPIGGPNLVGRVLLPSSGVNTGDLPGGPFGGPFKSDHFRTSLVVQLVVHFFLA